MYTQPKRELERIDDSLPKNVPELQSLLRQANERQEKQTHAARVLADRCRELETQNRQLSERLRDMQAEDQNSQQSLARLDDELRKANSRADKSAANAAAVMADAERWRELWAALEKTCNPEPHPFGEVKGMPPVPNPALWDLPKYAQALSNEMAELASIKEAAEECDWDPDGDQSISRFIYGLSERLEHFEERGIDGAEAEELRAGCERLVREAQNLYAGLGEPSIEAVPVEDIQELLDETDARDSAAYHDWVHKDLQAKLRNAEEEIARLQLQIHGAERSDP